MKSFTTISIALAMTTGMMTAAVAGDAKAPATGTAEEKAPEEKPTKKVASGGRNTSGPIKKSSGETTSKPAGETKKAPAKNPCGCASGDLQCAMKCAAGGG